MRYDFAQKNAPPLINDEVLVQCLDLGRYLGEGIAIFGLTVDACCHASLSWPTRSVLSLQSIARPMGTSKNCGIDFPTSVKPATYVHKIVDFVDF